jgi:hypothetical protein
MFLGKIFSRDTKPVFRKPTMEEISGISPIPDRSGRNQIPSALIAHYLCFLQALINPIKRRISGNSRRKHVTRRIFLSQNRKEQLILTTQNQEVSGLEPYGDDGQSLLSD